MSRITANISMANITTNGGVKQHFSIGRLFGSVILVGLGAILPGVMALKKLRLIGSKCKEATVAEYSVVDADDSGHYQASGDGDDHYAGDTTSDVSDQEIVADIWRGKYGAHWIVNPVIKAMNPERVAKIRQLVNATA